MRASHAHPELASILRGAPPHEIDRFLAENDVPIIERGRATFLFRGEVDAVHLRHFIWGLPAIQPFRRVPGTDLWFQILDIPDHSRVEYKLEVVRGGHGEWIEDPLNPHRARDPFGANSVCHGWGYELPDWTVHDPHAREGSVQEIRVRSTHLERACRIQLYLPARFRKTRRYPLLIVHDGPDYLEYANMKTVLDNLIHRLEISEMIVAFLNPRDRLNEYANDERHSRFLSEELVPRLENRFPIAEGRRNRCLMGASFGAIASFAAATTTPDLFGKLLLQSSSFAFTDIGPQRRGPVFEPIVEFVNDYREEPIRVADKMFVSCGTYESLIYENRSMIPVLRDTGMDVRYVEARDGHNWENWRDRLREGLSWLFPGPLWMVYE